MLLACFVGIPNLMFAQRTFQSTRSFSFRYQNDFFNATDKYYTQGVQFIYGAPFLGRSPVAHVLFGLKDATLEHAVLLEQQCFTPSSIRRDTIFTGDRPFAAALFLGQRMVSFAPQRALKLSSAIKLGVLGPCALCAEEQRGIHRALDNIEPLGWQHQVAGDVIVNYSLRIDKRVLRSSFAETSLGASAELGTYRTNTGLHGRVEVGCFNSFFEPAAPSSKVFHFSAYVEGQVTVIGYDATMQGGLFNASSPYTLSADAIERLVLGGGGGLRLTYRALSLTYAKTFITSEFVGGTDHGWGTCRIEVIL